MKRTGAQVFWFTGLSGSGKSTVAEGVRKRLNSRGLAVLILDGDTIRAGRHSHLEFSAQDIKTNNRLIAELCEDRRDQFDVIFVPVISPYIESRREARERLMPGFFEIYFDSDLQTVTRRDVKGLYAKARSGEIENMIGYSPGSPYEPPTGPDLRLDTSTDSPQNCIDVLYCFVQRCVSDAGVR